MSFVTFIAVTNPTSYNECPGAQVPRCYTPEDRDEKWPIVSGVRST